MHFSSRLFWLPVVVLLFSSSFWSGEPDQVLSSPRCGIVEQPATITGQKPVSPFSLAAPALRESSPVREPDWDWVDSTLAGMTLDEKIGQMMMPWYSSSSSANQVLTYKIGGCIFSSWNTSGAASVVQAVNTLQSLSTIPLWFAADFEAGVGTRFTEGTLFPMNMGVGAANDEVLAASAGWVTAREAWAMGIQIGFGPVVDVNTDPNNPIIATRSYGDRQDLVARMAQAFVSGAHRGGMLTCLKHYPGHGPTDQDSHSTLPVVSLSESELRRVHIYPYQQLIAGGYADLVMTAHVWFKALDPGDQPWPATLSYKAMTEILRTDLGFTGVSITDAFSMAGVSGIMDPDDAVVTAVKNGLDIILIPPDMSSSIPALKQAVQTAIIPESQIDASVRRILAAKSRMWLPEEKYRNEAEMWNTLQHPDHLAIAEALGRASITRVLQKPGVLPLQSEQKVLCLRLKHSSTGLTNRSYTNFTTRLDNALSRFELYHVNRDLDSTEINQYILLAADADRIVIAAYDWTPIMSTEQIELVNLLITHSTPVVFVSFGSPYHGLDLEGLNNYFCAYSNAEVSQWAAAEVLLGNLEPQGRLPISQIFEPYFFWQVY